MVPHLVKKFRVLWNMKLSYDVYKSTPTDLIAAQLHPVRSLVPYFF